MLLVKWFGNSSGFALCDADSLVKTLMIARLGKKSSLCWHNNNGRETAVCQQTFGQQQAPFPAKSGGFGVGFNKFTLAKRPASGGQPA
jgi:hypothetical protein